MPFYRTDPEAYAEMLAELDPEDLPPGIADKPPSGEFEYCPPETDRFDPEALGAVARLMVETLLAAGATELFVRYDGGYDEGFAFPESLRFGGESRPAAEVAGSLGSEALTAQIRDAARRESLLGGAGEFYTQRPASQVVTYALDELGAALATCLLGRGFGTGECSLYGAFTADLRTGALVDDPNAARPDTME